MARAHAQFALIANCLFAPLLLGERFRRVSPPSRPVVPARESAHACPTVVTRDQRDLLGILLAIVGAVTVVLSSNPSDTRLPPAALLAAVQQRIFVAYAVAYLVGAVVLAGLSERGEWVLVDIGLCVLFGAFGFASCSDKVLLLRAVHVCLAGGFTVLVTKRVSTLLMMEYMEMFTEWITYPILAVHPPLLLINPLHTHSP